MMTRPAASTTGGRNRVPLAGKAHTAATAASQHAATTVTISGQAEGTAHIASANADSTAA